MTNIVWILTLLSTSAASSAAPPNEFPEFDRDKASLSVAVATSVPGESYPEPEECKQADVICMRDPLWFSATTLKSVYGSAPTGQFTVSTYTHYGQPERDTPSAPRLILLLTHNNQTVMPVYASTQLTQRKDGEYVIVLYTQNPIHWLPCSVMDLKEPISARDFPIRLDVPRDEYYAKESPDLFTFHWRKATPRFGISVSRIQRHLQQTHPLEKDFSCEISDES